MTAAHGGYDSERVPLGGAAAVCERLCETWRHHHDVLLLGSGPVAPVGVRYKQMDLLEGRTPSSLGELEYANFCRRFELAISEEILRNPDHVVLSHDISEGPDFARLAVAGHRVVTLFHVDVVDYFNRFYLGELLPPFCWTGLYRGVSGWLPVPDVLRLVFDKQERCVRHCPYVVVPSERMKGILRDCYPDLPRERVQVVGWGSPLSSPPAHLVAEARGRLSSEWGLAGPMLLTLSRISPEKNQELVLKALLHGESRGEIPAGLCLVIAGAPAYMRGEWYLRRLQGLAARLRSVRVLFVGHLGGPVKRAAFELADLFVVGSRHESYGLTTMEAMQAGCPVVGMRSYGVEVTVDGSNGVVVDGGAGALWQALRDLLLSPERRTCLARGALESASASRFDAAASALEALLGRLDVGSPAMLS